MDMGTIGWFVIAWCGVALVVSMALGAFLSQVDATMGETDLATAAERRKVMRFMRTSAAKSVSTCNTQSDADSGRRIKLKR